MRTMNMKKAEALRHFGNNASELARHIGVNYQAIIKWPDPLPSRITDRVIVAMLRTGREIPKKYLKPLAPVL